MSATIPEFQFDRTSNYYLLDATNIYYTKKFIDFEYSFMWLTINNSIQYGLIIN